MGEENMQECPFDDPIFQDFFEQGKVDKLTTMEKEDYAKSILEYREVQDTIEYEREHARAEGLAKGKAEAKLEMAKLLLAQGVDIGVIVKTTGLTAEDMQMYNLS